MKLEVQIKMNETLYVRDPEQSELVASSSGPMLADAADITSGRYLPSARPTHGAFARSDVGRSRADVGGSPADVGGSRADVGRSRADVGRGG